MNGRGLTALQGLLGKYLTLCLALNPCQYPWWDWSTQLVVQLIIDVESMQHRPILSNGRPGRPCSGARS
ncbi:hypothetical protein WU83_09530 [Mycobacterium nebraskense]|nr:hypothetical protein WU83_09530 [Mycobacterium nebraskense]